MAKETKEEEKKEAKADVPKEEAKDEAKEVEVPAKFKSLVEEIEKMSVIELAELVKVLEDKFGVSSAAPVAMAAAPAAGGGEAGSEEEEKSDYDIELAEVGGQKIAVIKVLREVTGKGLKDAKDMTDKVPMVVKEKAPKEEAEEVKKKLEEAGAKVNLK